MKIVQECWDKRLWYYQLIFGANFIWDYPIQYTLLDLSSHPPIFPSCVSTFSTNSFTWSSWFWEAAISDKVAGKTKFQAEIFFAMHVAKLAGS